MTILPAEQALRDRGIRVTSERVQLYEVLTKHRKPLASKDIHALLGKNADRVTVYRTLETFVENGLARRVDIGHRHAHYELILDEHHHLICTSCGRIEDVAFCPDPVAIKKMLKESKHFAEVANHALEFYGRCTGCAKK